MTGPEAPPLRRGTSTGRIHQRLGNVAPGDLDRPALFRYAGPDLRSPTGPTALCSGPIAIGGSKLLANDDMLTLADTAPATPINGGTGIYRHAHGLLTPTNFGNNTDFTIKVTY